MAATTAGAIIASSLIGAAGSQIAASKQRSAQKKLAAQQLENQKRLARKKRVTEVSAMEQERMGDQKASALAQAGAQQFRNTQLQQRGIAPRKMTGFADLSRSVLDEGATG